MRALFITPLLIFLVVLIVLMVKLLHTEKVPESPLVGKPMPAFNLPAIHKGEPNLTSEDLKGHYSLVNVFASWCLTCKIEHPYLMKIKESGKVKIYGINWKDDRKKAQKFIEEHGNPYTKIGADDSGRVIVDLGVTGAPESFLISPDGIVLYRFAGVVTEDVWEDDILPLVE
ncbi:MAG: periplasmic protein thiol--disulfide oxidoreductase DsbE [Rickettsiaceae bacterium]|nr:periplasmic protein thiol--disulfide oxidoreductase DsbE [Rickettsiaceae bacterium]